MNNEVREFKCLTSKHDFQEVSVSSAFEIGKSYAESVNTIDANVEVINFFFGTRKFADRMHLDQALTLLEDCLSRIRKLLGDTLKIVLGDLITQLSTIIPILEMLKKTIGFFVDKFNWTEYHLTLRTLYLNILDILMDIFNFAKSGCLENCHELSKKLLVNVCEQYKFFLEKFTDPETKFFMKSSFAEREFFSEIFGKLFGFVEIIPSINPHLYIATWKLIHKLNNSHSKEIEKGSGDFLDEPVIFLCKRIREGICEAIHQTLPKDTLKITKFHIDLLNSIIRAFQGNFLPKTEEILNNLIFLQSAKYLGKLKEDILKTAKECMQELRKLQKNESFMVNMLNRDYSHDAELYAFLVISMEIYKGTPAAEDDPCNVDLLKKIFTIMPKCAAVFQSCPDVCEDLCRSISLVIIMNNTDTYKTVWMEFLEETLNNPTVYSTHLMHQIWRNIQMASEEKIRFDSFSNWKNLMEKLPQTSSAQVLLMEKILRTSFNCLSKESQQRVVGLNNPLKNYHLWSIIGLDVIPNHKKEFFIKGLSGEVLKLISDFVATTCTPKTFEDMIFILKILGRSSFVAERSLVEKLMEMWQFIGMRTNSGEQNKKLLSEIAIPLLCIFRKNMKNSLESYQKDEILSILDEISRGDWPFEIHIEIIKSLTVNTEMNTEGYEEILQCCCKSSAAAMHLLTSLKQMNSNVEEKEDVPPKKKFKSDVASKGLKMLQILKDMKEFTANCNTAFKHTPQCKTFANEMTSYLNKLK